MSLKQSIEEVMNRVATKDNMSYYENSSIKQISGNDIVFSQILRSTHKNEKKENIGIVIGIHLRPCGNRYFVAKFDVYRKDQRDLSFLNGFRFLAHHGKGIPDNDYVYDPKDDNYLWLISKAADFVSMLRKFDEYTTMNYYQPVFNM